MALLDGDDWWCDASKLQRQADFLESNPGCTAVFHNARVAVGVRLTDRRWTPPDDPGRLTLDSWMHLLEACAVLAEISPRPAVLTALASLVELLTERLARHPCGTCPDDFAPGWRDLPPSHHTVSYGHELERISLVLHAVDALGNDPEPFVDRFVRLTDHLAEVAVDRRRGGIYYRGAPCRLA